MTSNSSKSQLGFVWIEVSSTDVLLISLKAAPHLPSSTKAENYAALICCSNNSSVNISDTYSNQGRLLPPIPMTHQYKGYPGRVNNTVIVLLRYTKIRSTHDGPWQNPGSTITAPWNYVEI
ncbi:unnamed protein product [Rhizophagus irregularis]|nr:unnamed protein product [Rhizophagus irregularis]